MKATITEVFETCARETGMEMVVRLRRAKCPFHGSDRYTLSINDEKETWHCFVAHCDASKGGGYFDVPIIFGIATNRSDASRWLAKKGLIPPSTGVKDDHAPKRKILRKRIDVDTLMEKQRDVWREAQLDLLDEVRERGWIRIRDYTGEERQRIWERRLPTLREIERLTLEADECVKDGGHEVSIIDRFRVMRRRPDLYLAPKWNEMKKHLKMNVPNFEPGEIGVPNTWTEADWDRLEAVRSAEIDAFLTLPASFSREEAA